MRYAVQRPMCTILATVLTIVPISAFAAAQRTFVASYGLTTNTAFNCSLTKPCRAFAEAISVTGSKGEVVVLDSAGYGPVAITKSVSIIAPPGIYAGISVISGDGVTVNAPGAVVVLRGLFINGQGGRWGVHLQNAARVRIEGCTISNMAQEGVHHAAPGAELVMLDTIVRDNGNSGINVVADTSIVLDHVRSEHNQGAGLGIVSSSSEASATITDSIFAHNAGNGIVADANVDTPTYIHVERSTMSNNGGAGFVATTVHAGAVVSATLARNAINRNGGDGILLSGSNPGVVRAFVYENAIHGNKSHGINAHDQYLVRASANSSGSNLGLGWNCDGGSLFVSYGNNVIDVGLLAACLVQISGS